MRVFVNGQQVPAHFLARREMNFRQPWPAAVPPSFYQIWLDTKQFVEQMSQVYDQAVEQEKADQPFHHKGEYPPLDQLQELGYPSLQDLVVKDRALLEELVKGWLYLETLDQIVSPLSDVSPMYLLNTIDEVTVKNGEICIAGQAFVTGK